MWHVECVNTLTQSKKKQSKNKKTNKEANSIAWSNTCYKTVDSFLQPAGWSMSIVVYTEFCFCRFFPVYAAKLHCGCTSPFFQSPAKHNFHSIAGPLPLASRYGGTVLSNACVWGMKAVSQTSISKVPVAPSVLHKAQWNATCHLAARAVKFKVILGNNRHQNEESTFPVLHVQCSQVSHFPLANTYQKMAQLDVRDVLLLWSQQRRMEAIVSSIQSVHVDWTRTRHWTCGTPGWCFLKGSQAIWNWVPMPMPYWHSAPLSGRFRAHLTPLLSWNMHVKPLGLYCCFNTQANGLC